MFLELPHKTAPMGESLDIECVMVMMVKSGMVIPITGH